jgi:ubiquinone/menaquinone biosynthesis C-methylase UbiE
MVQASATRGATGGDPVALDWANLDLPDAWPDKLNLLRPTDLLTFIRRIIGPRTRVELPDGLPGRQFLPTYLLEEFHHLPNGTYSERMASAYADWFDRVMLGTIRGARRAVAHSLLACSGVLDVGCGAGGLAGALHEQGANDVWALDACPYLLKYAARRNPGVKFVQGLAEATGFPSERFDGVGACFLFHELPSGVADRCLGELHRILKPGGLLSIAEPAREHAAVQSVRGLLRLGGLRALYFGLLARVVYEPLLTAWHSRDVATSFPRFGFVVESDETRTPFRMIVARKISGSGPSI